MYNMTPSVLAGVVCVLFAASGCALYPDDNAFEEVAESALEDYAENKLGLPDDCLDGTIDLSLGSEE